MFDGSIRPFGLVAERCPAAAIIVPPRSTAVPSETAETTPPQRDRHLQSIAQHGRAAWQNASGYTKRARAEAAIGRFKQVIGDGLRSRTDRRRATEVDVAVHELSSDAWENQMMFLMQHGYRVIAHDRRGFGRSSQPGHGYDYDTFADDLAALVDALDLSEVTLVGHSMGGGEVARYIGRHGEKRVSKAAFVAAVTPFLLKTESNPHGVPVDVFDGMRKAVQMDRSQWNKDVTMSYFSYNRPGAKVSEGIREDYWRQGMATGILTAYDAIAAFSETDFREDLAKIWVPTLVIHGSDDQIVPVELSGSLTADIIKNAQLIVYEGGPHGLLMTHRDKLDADLLAFVRS